MKVLLWHDFSKQYPPERPPPPDLRARVPFPSLVRGTCVHLLSACVYVYGSPVARLSLLSLRVQATFMRWRAWWKEVVGAPVSQSSRTSVRLPCCSKTTSKTSTTSKYSVYSVSVSNTPSRLINECVFFQNSFFSRLDRHPPRRRKSLVYLMTDLDEIFRRCSCRGQ